MSEEDAVANIKSGVGVVQELVKSAGQSEEAQVAAKNIGTTAVTVTKAINNALLPLAAINYGFEKAKLYFEKKFQKDIAELTADIPSDKIVEPNPAIAGPALQGLSFTHGEPDLRDMFLHLLKTSMNGDTAIDAHPAFAEILKQLSPQEAKYLKIFALDKTYKPVVRVRRQTKYTIKTKTTYALTHLTNAFDTQGDKDVKSTVSAPMIDNWIRLGLIDVAYDEVLEPHLYDWVDQHPSYLYQMENFKKINNEILYDQGYIRITSFGHKFLVAVGL